MKDLTPLDDPWIRRLCGEVRGWSGLAKMFRDISTPIFFRLLWSVLRSHEVRRPIDPVRR